MTRYTTPSVADTLDLAADLIDQRGWSVGYGWDEDPTGSLCLEGGILAAIGIPGKDLDNGDFADFRACPAYTAVSDYLKSIGIRQNLINAKDDKVTLWRWNDNHATAKATVTGVLRATAQVEREKVAA